MKKILLLLTSLFFVFSSQAQIQTEFWKGTGFTYTKKNPTYTPTASQSEVAIDSSTAYIWIWDRDCPCWRELGSSLQFTETTGVPSYVPNQGLGRFAMNIGDSLYAYRGGSWRHLNNIPNLAGYLTWADTATIATQYFVLSQGFLTVELDGDPTNELQTISISNDTIYLSNGGFAVLPPSSDTSGYNQSLSYSGDTLYLTDAGGTIFTVIPSVDLSGYVEYSDSTIVFVTPSQLVDSINAIPATVDTATYLFQDSILIYYANGIEFGRDTIPLGSVDLSGYVLYSDSITTFVTPTQLSDSLAAIPVTIDTATYLFQDSILIYYANGVEFGRDTISFPYIDLTPYLEWSDTLTFIATKSDIPIVSDTATFLFQDSILIYYANGIEFGRDTVRFDPVDLSNYVQFSDSLTTFVTPSQLVDSINAIPAVDLTGYVEFADSLTTFVTPAMLDDSTAAIRADFPVNTDSTTVLFQDSILIYYTLNGVEYGRDTIRIAGSGGGGGVSGSGTTDYLTKWTGATVLGNSTLFDDGVNVGIRTNTPISGLHIRKAILAATGEFVTVDDSITGNSVKTGLFRHATLNTYPGIWLNQASPTTNNYAFLYDPDAQLTLFNAPAGGGMRFRINNSDVVAISPTGNVGIANGTPGSFAKLNVKGTGTTSTTASLFTQNSSNQLNIYSTDDLTTHFGGKIVLGHPTGPQWSRGTGSPEGVVTAPVGSRYSRTDGGTNTATYRKETGSGNTGWVADASGATDLTIGGSGPNYIIESSSGTDVTIEAGQNIVLSEPSANVLKVEVDRILYDTLYVPGLGPITNVTSATADTFTVTRIGNVVTCDGHIYVTPTAGGNATTILSINIPIPSDLVTDSDGHGVGVCDDVNSFRSGIILANGATDRLTLRFSSNTTSPTTIAIRATYQIK